MTKECIICGKVFDHTTRGNRAVTCSNECRKERRKHTDKKRDRAEYWKERSNTDEYRERCAKNTRKYSRTNHGKAYIKQYRDDNKERLKQLNKDNAIRLAIEQNKATNITIIKCIGCGMYEVVRSITNRELCKKCNAKQWHIEKSKSKPTIPCIVCDKQFRTHLHSSKFCSNECRVEKRKQDRRAQSGSVRKKYIRKGLFYMPVNSKKVFKRDKWRCKDCGCKVQKKSIYADNAAEVDHIVPTSNGGPNTYSNVQTLCRKCNQAKSNNYHGQLVLSL